MTETHSEVTNDAGAKMYATPKSRERMSMSRYRLGTYLVRPDRKGGRPGIRPGVDQDGNPVLIKVWPKAGSQASTELREIWRNEVRQLHRVGGYPGASENIATLQRADEDESGFYLVLEPGQRRPLATILEDSSHENWLTNARAPVNRALLWRNMLRISGGIQTLHDQGLLHRNINEWAILATGGREPDFQLTGFEWSVRIAGATTEVSGPRRSRRTSHRKSGKSISFMDDWRDFGALITKLLEAPTLQVVDTKTPASDVAAHLNVEEVRVLRMLLRAEPAQRLDGEVIERQINEVLRQLRAQIANRNTQLHLVVRLGANSQLTQSLREVSEYIESDATEEQLSFVRDDLSETPRLLAVKSEWDSESRMILQGTKLTYRLRPFYPASANSTGTWEFAYSDTCEQREPARANIVGSLELEPSALSVLMIGDARRSYTRMRGRLRSWEELKEEFDSDAMPKARDKRLHHALALTQFIEAVFAAADAFPVEVVDQSMGSAGDVTRLTIRTREDHERDGLSDALRLRAPAVRFPEVLMDQRVDGNWVLTESRHVGTQHPTDTEWGYERTETAEDGSPIYVFAGATPPASLKDALMIPGGFIGRDTQFRRRLSALRALADHAELMWMLVDPRRRILDTHESIEDHELLNELDSSKQEAMAAIVNTVPLYLLQGPPGVGKTRMVKGLVQYIFKNESAARVLLTAQSNAAVDHLLETLHEVLAQGERDMLAVRCRAPDRNGEPSAYEVQRRAGDVLRDFAQSGLVETVSPKLRDRARYLATQMEPQTTSDHSGKGSGSSTANARQAVEGLVVRAANVVFATSNSRELERLVDERGQFDWTVVEEAGKATGGELIAPLLLSYRRLMIGDHKQLAPFGADRLVRLLEDPASVIEAVRWGRHFVGRTLRDPSTDEVLDEVEQVEEAESTDGEFGTLCGLALESVLLFERLVEDEFSNQARSPNVRKIARRLDKQHRMHPAIAQLVSRCFYGGELSTHQEAINRFNTTRCPVGSSDVRRLPDVPLVVVDMPYVQTTGEMRHAEEYPRWRNRLEVDAVMEVLGLLEARHAGGGTPSLAVLSPYSEQVKSIQSRLEEEGPKLQNLRGFRPGVAVDRFCGTVDSFQGNEADVVVVSLVRNNHHSSIRAALGFLTEARRMNVLLSRAKWRLVLVFSKEFLDTVLKSSRGTTSASDVAFLSELLTGLEAAQIQGEAATISWDQVREKAVR